MNIQFTYADGTVAEARILPIDRIMFERKFGTSVAQSFTGQMHEEHLIWLGWHALKRAGKASDEFDAWLGELEDYAVPMDPEVPTEPAASTTT